MGDLREPNLSFLLASPEDRPASLVSYSDLSSISPERWAIAEKATHKIILKVLPTAVSDERRREVIDYIFWLIGTHLGCQVFPYGSVPLKTYLPDGDIDLTAFGGASSEDWAESFVSVLKGEDHNRDAEFIVKDVQLIRAEVKIVKCIVQNIVVDISLNQIGGLCTLCFLEQVDRLIGKDHLFKRSIILIKAWCYYESRLLGAPHGLISTYALETLVLYIFHFFHSILDGPLAVLYKFLEYFSKFDWENYGISLNGPVRLASLPEFVVEMPENGGGDLLLSSEFLRHCTATFSVPSRRVDSHLRTFQAKYLNIVDPLKENNNLGRSVAKGNFFRIRSALTYGARKLDRILMQPGCDINKELASFFSNTLDRHGSGQRPDVHGPFSVHRYGNVNPKMLLSEAEACSLEISSTPESKSSVSVETMDECCSTQNESSADGVNGISTSAVNAKYHEELGHHHGSVQVLPSGSVREPEWHMKGNVLDHRIRTVGDAKDLASYKLENLKISSDEAKSSNLAGKVNVSSVRMPFFAPHLYFSNSKAKSGSQIANTESKQPEKPGKSIHTEKSCGSNGVNGYGMKNDDVDKDDAPAYGGGVLPAHSSTKPVVCSRTLPHMTSELSGRSEEALESSETLSVLEGDYDAHFNSLKYGRSSFEYASGVSPMPIPSLSPSLYQCRRPWEALQNSTVSKANGFPHMVVNGVILFSPFYAMNSMIAPGMNFGSEDMRKPRGTGTYFPNPSRPAQGFRPTTGRARYITSPRTRGTGESETFNEGNVPDLNTRKLPQSAEFDDQSRVKQAPSDNRQKVSPRAKGDSSSNGFVSHSEGEVECGSACKASLEALVMEKSRHWQRKDFTAKPQNSNLVSPTGTVEMQDPDFSKDHDRVSKKSSYRLKDEDDFPPLSV